MLLGLFNNWKNKLILFNTRCPKPSRASSTPAVCTDYTWGGGLSNIYCSLQWFIAALLRCSCRRQSLGDLASLNVQRRFARWQRDGWMLSVRERGTWDPLLTLAGSPLTFISPPSWAPSWECHAGAATSYQVLLFQAGMQYFYLLDQFSSERQILNDTLLQSLAFWAAHCSVFVRASSYVSTDCVSRLASVSQCRWRQPDVYLEHLESSSSLVRWVLSKDVIWGQLPKVLCWDFHFLPH